MYRPIRLLFAFVLAALVASPAAEPGLAAQAASFPIGDRVMVDADWLNVRAEPGLDEAIVNVLPFGFQAFFTGGR
ncbi:MAG TPA: hypothetical protein VGR16_02020 [Thermomicrobiales bacterium]|nr:hypothetical protein [Thermomicrobiales bacterium]